MFVLLLCAFTPSNVLLPAIITTVHVLLPVYFSWCSTQHDLYVCIILNSGSNNIQHKRAKIAIRRLSARKLNTCIIAMESVVQRTGTEQMGISAMEAVKTTVGTVSEVLNVSYCFN